MNKLYRSFVDINYDKKEIYYKCSNDRIVSEILVKRSFDQFFNFIQNEKDFLNRLIGFPEDFLEYIKLKYEL